MRVGIGYDAHVFEETRHLVLGGVTIDGAVGLSGWSDADVLCHAIIDALLGAAGLGDLGTHFPESAVAEGCSSMDLLGRTLALLGEAGFRVCNVDCTVVIEKVRISPHREAMQEKIASALQISRSSVNVKATSTDQLGFVGRGDGAVGMAVALIEPIPM